jgi:hypothetical protein
MAARYWYAIDTADGGGRSDDTKEDTAAAAVLAMNRAATVVEEGASCAWAAQMAPSTVCS